MGGILGCDDSGRQIGVQKQIEELRHKAEQGSQQLQGEVQELERESLLGSAFVYDRSSGQPRAIECFRLGQ